MFEDIDAAMAALGDFTPEALREAIVAMLIKVSVLLPASDQAALSLTFTGGSPVMSASLGWPAPEMPEDIEAFVERGGSNHAPHIRKSLLSRQPYSFIAQIDLEELPEDQLPNSGRLLFFYDMAVGPWDNSARSGRVIWDQAPLGDLTEHQTPQALIKAEKDWNTELRNYVPEPLIIDDDMRKLMRDAGMADAEINEIINTEVDLPEHVDQHVYIGPKQTMRIASHLQTPLPFNLEWDAFQASVTARAGAELGKTLEDVYLDAEMEYEYRPAFQILGLPSPEQSDPRYDAAFPLVVGKAFANSDDWQANKPAILAAARDMTLLFQFSVADWLQENAEGTVYFVIHNEDLKARAFDKAIAVYQQT